MKQRCLPLFLFPSPPLANANGNGTNLSLFHLVSLQHCSCAISDAECLDNVDNTVNKLKELVYHQSETSLVLGHFALRLHLVYECVCTVRVCAFVFAGVCADMLHTVTPQVIYVVLLD